MPATGAKEGQEELDIQRVFPIYGEFGISISQMRSEVSGLRSRPVSTAPNILEQTRSSEFHLSNSSVSYLIILHVVITLSITPAEGALSQAPLLTFCTSDVDGLKLMVAECKRLKGTSGLYPGFLFSTFGLLCVT